MAIPPVRVRIFLIELSHFEFISEDVGALPVVWEEDGPLADDGDAPLPPDHKTTTKAMPQIKPTSHDTKIALKNILHMGQRPLHETSTQRASIGVRSGRRDFISHPSLEASASRAGCAQSASPRSPRWFGWTRSGTCSASRCPSARVSILSRPARQCGDVSAFVMLGGNFVPAVPERDLMEAAWRRLRPTVQVLTKLNRSACMARQISCASFPNAADTWR
jgi:hypothetical protein